jgi:hypothetical protein
MNACICQRDQYVGRPLTKRLRMSRLSCRIYIESERRNLRPQADWRVVELPAILGF